MTAATAFAWALAAALLVTGHLAWADNGTGQWRLRRDEAQAATQGPLAQALALDPSVVEPVRGRWVTEARWRRSLSLGPGLTVTADVAATAVRPDAGAATLKGRFDELLLSREQGPWTLSAGRQVVAWDVGFGFRPNDVVQQERRLTLIDAPLQGRPVVALEHFDGDSALSLAWANPGSSEVAQVPQGQEQALAGRLYQRLGDADLHLFARWGEHTRASLGAATTWVVGDALSLHASGRMLQRRVASTGPADAALYRGNPWQAVVQGQANQALVGMTWTSAQRWSVLMELWHDGTAMSNVQWRDWQARNAALGGLTAPAGALAAQWAWQATPLAAPQLHCTAALARLSGQDGPWQWALDALWHPADRGRIVTASLVWQGDRTRLAAAWRQVGGPQGALAAQLPQRRSAAAEWSWSF